MSELDAAKRELSEYQQLTEQKLQDEREKTHRAVVSCILSLLYYRSSYAANVGEVQKSEPPYCF